MISIEGFLLLAAAVVLIGLVVWRRDVKSGRIQRPKSRSRAAAAAARTRLGDPTLLKQTSDATAFTAGAVAVSTLGDPSRRQSGAGLPDGGWTGDASGGGDGGGGNGGGS